MPSLLTLRSLRLGLGFALLLGLGLCFVPLFGAIGPESALVLGAVLPPWASSIGASTLLAGQKQGRRSTQLLGEAVLGACLLPFTACVLLAVNALRIKTCDPFGGATFMALGPFAGCALAALVGAGLASVIRKPWLAITCGALLPIAAMGRALSDFFTTPQVFALGHFFGYFPGTFYDRRVEVPDAWLFMRVTDLAIFAALWALIVAFRERKSGRFRLSRGAQHPVVLVLALGLCTFASVRSLDAYERGERSSSAFIAHKLGRVLDGARCRLVVPRELDDDEAQRLAEDCDFRVTQLEERLGVKETERITAFLFRTQGEKRALMGAGRVYIAKPWRREVYLHLSGWPHPVLAHELAHVVARHAASGPLGIAGRLGGLIPEPTLVEGLAVALEPIARDELTPHQWAKAAHAAKVAPSLEALLGASFLSHNQGLAYTLAGSFLGYLLETHGPETLRNVYRSGDVPRVLGAPWKELETRWKQFLEGVPLPPQAEGLARLRFERPSIFSQVCPHEVERLGQELSAALSAGDTSRAVDKCRAVLEIDPNDASTRATLVSTLAFSGDLAAAEEELQALGGAGRVGSSTLARAKLGLADASFLRGSYAQAETVYRDMLTQPLPDSELRQLEVKLLALAAGDPLRRWVSELLIGRQGRGSDTRVAMHAIAEIRASSRDGLGDYLLARQLHAAGRHDLAHPLYASALDRGLPTRRLRVECLVQRGESALASGHPDDAEQSYAAVAALPDASEAEQLLARDFRARVAYRRTRLAGR